MTLHVRTAGDWPPAQVHTSWAAGTHAVPPEARDLIERTWGVTLARPGVKLFDGPMCRMESWAERDGRLEVALSRTTYKQFLGTNMSHPELADRYGPAVLANPVGVSPALETADGYLLLGRRNDSVAYYPGRIHPFAGSLEPTDGAAAAPDPFAAVRRELAEELSMGEEDLADVRCTGIAEDTALRQPELIFRALSTRTRAEIEARVARDEHHGAVAVRATADGVAPLLRDPQVTPVGLAAVLLWGRVRLGDDWYRREMVGGRR